MRPALLRTGWLVDRAKELTEKWSASRWAVDATGPAASLIEEMEQAGLVVHRASAKELAVASGQFYDGVVNRRLRIRRHAQLDEAVAGAVKRPRGDAWAWARKSAAADVCPLVAMTLALWAAGQERVSVYEDRGLLSL